MIARSSAHRLATALACIAMLGVAAPVFAQPAAPSPSPTAPSPGSGPAPTPEPAPISPYDDPPPATPQPAAPQPAGPTAPMPAPQPAGRPRMIAPATPSAALQAGNDAATRGDWATVASLLDPLLHEALAPAELAEAHRLAGLAAFFQQRPRDAEEHFLAYLRLDPDAQLDPALVPPDAVTFFADVRARHAAELRARKPLPKRYWLLNLVPPGGQIQNGEKTKAWVVGGLLVAFAGTNIATYAVLHSWCTPTNGPSGTSETCDDRRDHSSAANTLKTINIAAGIGLILTYAYGVYDGGRGYSRISRERSFAPYVAPMAGGAGFGLVGRF
ncbi:MAG TPA: hypothetical protein VGM88_32440 [Kofleriaceae bacterium]|jgi:hypothetical protein